MVPDRGSLCRKQARPGLGLWALAAGVGQVALWPRLPFDAGIAGMAGVCVLVVGALVVLGVVPAPGRIRWALYRFVLPFLLGTCWGLSSNHQSLSQRLPLPLHGADFKVRVQLSSLPQKSPATFSFGPKPRSVTGYLDARFRARVLEASAPGLVGQDLLLGWYRADSTTLRDLAAGSHWQMTVRLKRPRGSANPHTFDYEAWLLQQGIYATGYVRDQDGAPQFLTPGTGLNAVREALRAQIHRRGLDHQALIGALLLGDKTGLDAENQALLQRTGTAHLLAISGLHVGMVAGCFFMLGGLIGRLLGLTGWRYAQNPLLLAGVAALLAAAGYTLVSGAPLSAQRALIMTAVGILALLSRRRISADLAYALALAAVLLLQPLAVLNAGFWLSFVAVGVLILRFQGRSGSSHSGALNRLLDWGRGAMQSQWAILVGLLLPSVLIFSGISVSGLVLNLIAIPWLGLLILPAVLLGAAVPLAPLKTALWQFSDWQLGCLMDFLQWADRVLPGWQSLPVPGVALAGMLAISCLCLLLPRGVPGRHLGWCLLPVVAVGLLPWQRPVAPYFQLTVLDVGQGLAVAAETERHTLVFDSGADSAGGWSGGSSVAAPYLIGQGRQSLDALVVSHGDRDHAGGVAGLLQRLPARRLIGPGRLPHRLAAIDHATGFPGASPCIAGNRETFGELSLTWLWPRSGAMSGEENDHSCVGLLAWRGARILLTGDISSRVESQLQALYPDFAPIDVLVAPHHGSRTSSSAGFIQWARPGKVIFSAGFRHHFGHPHPEVVERYASRKVQQFNTAETGGITFSWSSIARAPDTQCARSAPKFWLSVDHHGGLAPCE